MDYISKQSTSLSQFWILGTELGKPGRKVHIILHEFTSDRKDNCLK